LAAFDDDLDGGRLLLPGVLLLAVVFDDGRLSLALEGGLLLLVLIASSTSTWWKRSEEARGEGEPEGLLPEMRRLEITGGLAFKETAEEEEEEAERSESAAAKREAVAGSSSFSIVSSFRRYVASPNRLFGEIICVE
jgi:hypothetical protein